jgi:hypothetical protein
MFGSPSTVTRIAVGKTVGLMFGLAGFLTIPYLLPEANPLLRWGFLLWYLTLGGVVGVAGALDWHLVPGMALPWWLRSPLIGAWMNLVLTLIAYDQLGAFGESLFGAGAALASPFRFVAEGALAGLVIGYAATRAGGEGPDRAAG